MLPVLLDLKFIKIYTFGVFLVLAFFWGSFVLWKNIRLTAQKEAEIFDAMFISLTFSLLVSRVVYVILNFPKFGFDFFKFILINGYPGLSLYGALLGFFPGLWLYLTLKKFMFKDIVDYFVTPVFIALTFGKLGSFFSGTEFGIKTKFPLALKYFGQDGLRHLTPLYEAILFAIGIVISYRLLLAVRKEKYVKGSVFYFFCWYFAFINILFDKIRINPLYLFPLKSGLSSISINLFISVCLLLTVSLYYLLTFKSYLTAYGRQTYKKLAKKVAAEIGKRNVKPAKADRSVEKK